MDEAFEMLKVAHQEIHDLYKQSRANGGKTDNAPIFARIKQALDALLHIEETIVYPACQKHPELRRLTLEAYDAHNEIKELLYGLDVHEWEGARDDSRLRTLMSRVETHVAREEGRLYPLADKVMRRSELSILADEVSSALRRISPEKGALMT